MFNLYEILQKAQDGQAIGNLAKQFGISPEQAEAVVRALLPTFSTGFQSSLMNPATYSSFLGALSNPQHQAAYSDPAAASSATTASQGNDLLSQMFGAQALEPIAQQAAALSGINPQLIQRMLPVVASMLMGGFLSFMREKGWGSFFDQFAQAGTTGWESIFGQMFGAGTASQQRPEAGPQEQPGQTSPAGGGFSDIWGSVLGQAFGGGQRGQGQPPAAGMPNLPGFDPSMIQAGFDALSKMFQPGTPAAASRRATSETSSPDSNLADEIGDILSNKKR